MILYHKIITGHNEPAAAMRGFLVMKVVGSNKYANGKQT
jgi:hypothetical protein